MADIPSKPENLNSLISALKLTADEKDRVNNVAQKVKLYLQQQQADLPFRINRVKVAGSFEKHTALAFKYDVDLVVVVNSDKDLQKFLAKRKEIFDKMVKAISNLKGTSDLENKKSHVLTFQYESVHFDLLLGWNAVEGSQEQPHLVQHVRLLEVMKNIKDHLTHKLLSPSFVDSITDWVLHQKQYVTDAILLGKYWNSTLLFISSKCNNRRKPRRFKSYVIELLMIHLAKDCSKPVELFVKFLDFLAVLGPPTQNIVAFDDNFKPCIATHPEQKSNYPLRVFSKHQCFDVVQKFNQWDQLKKQAAQTRALLTTSKPMIEVFQPQFIMVREWPKLPENLSPNNVKAIRFNVWEAKELCRISVTISEGQNIGGYPFVNAAIIDYLNASCALALPLLMDTPRVHAIVDKVIRNAMHDFGNNLFPNAKPNQNDKIDNWDVVFLVKVGHIQAKLLIKY